MSGMTTLEANIAKFEKARDELNEAIRQSHEVLKDIKEERKIIERLLREGATKVVCDRINAAVGKELEEFGDQLESNTHKIYNKIGSEVDKLIAISLGDDAISKCFAKKTGKQQDLRPMLAAKFREWILEVIDETESEVQ